jgi:HPt (histidine-containing phosphotransfer) domain-containing protein
MDPNAKITVTIDPDLEDLIPEFLDLTRKDIGSIRDAAAKADLETVRRLGHTLKGSGGGYGFDKISELGAKIEQLAKAGQTDAVAPLVAELQDYLDRVEIVYG